MTITKEQLEQMVRIYNTLLEVQTKGESTFIMSDALRALEQIVTAISKTAQQEAQSNPQEG